MRLNELLAYNDIVIQCHDFPDADTIASGFGIYTYLKENGKAPSLVYSGKQQITKPNLLHMIEILEIPIRYISELDRPEALVTADCCYGEGNVTKFDADNIFVIDHHHYSKSSDYRNEIRSNYSSCSTVVSQLLKEEDFCFNDNKNLATALYYGLYTDSNGMNEINHPADKDLRDLTNFDEISVNLLKNSNLSLEEIKIAGDALKHYKYNDIFRFAIVEAMPCDPNILGFISDLLLQVDKVDTCVVFCRGTFGAKLSVRSCISDIKATEMVKYIVGKDGSGGGHYQKAGGRINIPAENIDILRLISERMTDYHTSFDIIHAASYDADFSSMSKFRKKKLSLGYIKSTDIVERGSELCIRTLESDLNVKADDDLYIMIGILGEVYPIKKHKFDTSYSVNDRKFELHAEYNPSVINKDTFSSVDLLPYANSCVGVGNTEIYARELTRTVKVYTSWDKNNYMLGQCGDYLAVRCDDHHDVYIIERSIFLKTYESSETL